MYSCSAGLFLVLRRTVVPVNISPGDLTAGPSRLAWVAVTFSSLDCLSALWVAVDCGWDEVRDLEASIMRNCIEKDREKELPYSLTKTLKLPVPANFFHAARSAWHIHRHANEFCWPSLKLFVTSVHQTFSKAIWLETVGPLFWFRLFSVCCTGDASVHLLFSWVTVELFCLKNLVPEQL